MRGLNKNKKGDIPVTILVIGVFAIGGLALLTFFISDFNISNSFVGLEIMDKLNVMVEEYQFYSSKGVIDDLRNDFNWIEEGGVRYLELQKVEVRKDFFFFNSREVILFYAKVPLPN